MEKPYHVEISTHGCPLCQSDAEWDIVGPAETAQSQTWGNKEEADYICELMNDAYAVGRASFAQQIIDMTKEPADAEDKTQVVEAPPPSTTTTEDDIPF